MSSTTVESACHPLQRGPVPRVTIDHRMYPHIFEDIVHYVSSSRPTLFALRCTCCDVAQVIDPYLVTHLVISEEGDEFDSSIEVRPYGCGRWFPPWGVGGKHYYDEDADEYDDEFDDADENEDGQKVDDDEADWDADEEGDGDGGDGRDHTKDEDADEDQVEASHGSSDEPSTLLSTPATSPPAISSTNSIALKDATDESHAPDDSQDLHDIYQCDNCSDSDSTYVPSESDSGSELETVELWYDYGLQDLPGPAVLDVVGPVPSHSLYDVDCSDLRTVRFRPLPRPRKGRNGGRHPNAATVSIVSAETVVEFADWEDGTAGKHPTIRLETPHTTHVKRVICNIRFHRDDILVGGVIIPPELSQLLILEEVVFVFQRNTDRPPLRCYGGKTNQMFRDIITTVAAALPAVRATFVGLENFNPHWVYGDNHYGQCTFYICLEIDRALRSLHPDWSASELRGAHSGVSFMSLSDYRLKIGPKQFKLETVE